MDINYDESYNNSTGMDNNESFHDHDFVRYDSNAVNVAFPNDTYVGNLPPACLLSHPIDWRSSSKGDDKNSFVERGQMDHTCHKVSRKPTYDVQCHVMLIGQS